MASATRSKPSPRVPVSRTPSREERAGWSGLRLLALVVALVLLLAGLWTVRPWADDRVLSDPGTVYEVTGKAWLLEDGESPVSISGLAISNSDTGGSWDAPVTVMAGGHFNFFVSTADSVHHVMPDTEVRSATGGLARIEHFGESDCPAGAGCAVTSIFVAIDPLPGTYSVEGGLRDGSGNVARIVIEFDLVESESAAGNG